MGWEKEVEELQRRRAFAERMDGEKEVIEQTRGLTASHKKPRYVTFLATLRKNHAGMVDKNLLSAKFMEKTSGKQGAAAKAVQARY